VKVHASLSGVAGHHTNDMVVDQQGRAYVGNFGFRLDEEIRTRGVESVLADHPTSQLARVDPDGSVHVAATDLHFPNGPVITPDGRTLIIAETLAMRLTAFDIGPDGTLSNRRVWPRSACARRTASAWTRTGTCGSRTRSARSACWSPRAAKS